MAGTPLQNFGDFMATTGPVYLTSPDKMVNEATKNTYVLSRFLKGRGMDEVIQGGSSIKDTIMLDDASTYGHYQPNSTFSWTNPQVTDTISVSWRFSKDHMAWTDQEIELNMPENATSDQAKVAYKKMKMVKEQRMWTSMLNGMENDLWAAPANQQGDMETATGELPYSIPSFITEDKTNFHPTGWTTIMGLDPASKAKWRNQVSNYDHTDPDDAGDNRTGLINAFDEMFLKCRWVPVPGYEQYMTDPKLNRQFITTSRQGITLYSELLRRRNDRLISPQDAAYTSPKYGGIDLVYVSTLDTAPLYTAAAEASGQPRYQWINANFLKPIFHKTRYFYKHDIMTPTNQFATRIMPVDSWWNLFCCSRNRQGIVAPVAPSN